MTSVISSQAGIFFFFFLNPVNAETLLGWMEAIGEVFHILSFNLSRPSFFPSMFIIKWIFARFLSLKWVQSGSL